MSTKKIFVLISSGTGHINPVLGIVQELSKQPNLECIFYGIEEHRDAIGRTGAQFRLFTNRNYANTVFPIRTSNSKEKPLLDLIYNLMDCAYDILPQLLKDYEQDHPDLIFFDSSFLPARYLFLALQKKGIRYLATIQITNQLNIDDFQGINVKMVEFYPNFVYSKSIVESVPEMNIFQKDLNTLFKIGNLFVKQAHISWTFGLSIYNPIDFIFAKTEYTKVVAVFPELQPKVEEFDTNFKFVGQCVSEEARGHELENDQELKSILFKYKTNDSNKQINDSKLILVSIGTVFSHNTFVYEEIIKALREFNNSPGRKLRLSQFLVIFSLGDASFKTLNDKINAKELSLPENIILRSKVPQLEILKRADLFITHCGMNSTIESIKYTVPIIGIPIQGDQPLVARRVCDELSAGVRLDVTNLKSNEIGDAIDKVLSDEKYAKNMKELSLASAKYNGITEGTKIILDILSS